MRIAPPAVNHRSVAASKLADVCTVRTQNNCCAFVIRLLVVDVTVAMNSGTFKQIVHKGTLETETPLIQLKSPFVILHSLLKSIATIPRARLKGSLLLGRYVPLVKSTRR